MKVKYSIFHIRQYSSKDQKAVIDLWQKCALIRPRNNPKLDIERKQKVNPELFLVELQGNPDIQNKPGKLTDTEYEHIMTHTQIGPTIVKSIANENIVNIIRYHHTRYDGNGKGQTLANSQIPLGARIVTLSDAFDAMTSERPYRKSFPLEDAISEVKRCRGTQFDPQVVDAFLRMSNTEMLAIINTHLNEP